MTLENLNKKYAHLINLTKGNHKSGNTVRDALIVSDAKRNLKELLKKFPQLEKKEVKEDKSKTKI